MKYDFNVFYKTFEKVKSKKEFIEYCKEISDNTAILNSEPFDTNRAKSQITHLTVKYELELNRLANIYGNGMFVSFVTFKKNENQIKSELQYINNQIPIIALVRELPKDTLKNLLGID